MNLPLFLPLATAVAFASAPLVHALPTVPTASDVDAPLFQWYWVSDAADMELPSALDVDSWDCPAAHLLARGTVQWSAHLPEGGEGWLMTDADASFTIERTVAEAKRSSPMGPRSRLRSSSVPRIPVDLEAVPAPKAHAALELGRFQDLLTGAVSSWPKDLPLIVMNTDGSALIFLPRSTRASIQDADRQGGLAVRPDPADDQAFISGVPKGATWSLIAVSGKVVRKGKHAGEGELVLDVAGLAPGKYVLSVTGSGDERSTSFIKH